MKHSAEKLLSGGDDHTIAGYLCKHPKQTPKQAARKLFPKPSVFVRLWRRWGIKQSLGDASRRTISQHHIDRSAKLGNWGKQRPTDLFLKIYDDVCMCLERDPLAGAASPPMLGQNGTIPHTIVSVIPDIMKHYYDVIVSAEKEVLLATNYWQPSNSVNTVTEALKELSRRSGEKGCPKPVVKLIYDRGNWKQIFNNRLNVSHDDWKALDLPLIEEIPNIHLTVVNFHRPLLGTFHMKMLIVDRKLACVNSNNIQDRPNVEMMTHLEGDIVDSFLDTFLTVYELSVEHVETEDERVERRKRNRSGSSYWNGTDTRETVFELGGHGMKPLKSRMNYSAQNNNMLEVPRSEKSPSSSEDQASSSTGHNGTTPPPSKPIKSTAPRDEGDFGLDSGVTVVSYKIELKEEQAREQSRGKSRRLRALSDALNSGALSKTFCNLPDADVEHDFASHVFHAPHEPFPIALVNRKPHGMPGHQDIRVPQDAAWMAMFRYAEKKIFIQTPTFNAKRAVNGALSACRRGVTVTLYLDLGFNDKGESIPFQGGTNEEVVRKMYEKLRADKKEQYLNVFWYTGKDQIRPLNAVHKSRNCHVKFASIDDQVAIMGNGNQDTQSWMHSAEVNIMIDSPKIVSDWHHVLRTNQNTHLYGKVDTDGIWRDNEGNTWEYHDRDMRIKWKQADSERNPSKDT